MIDSKLIEILRNRFRLDWKGIHGASHWSRVRQNGLLLAERIGPAVNVRVVELFAFLRAVNPQVPGSSPGRGAKSLFLPKTPVQSPSWWLRWRWFLPTYQTC